MPLIRDVSKMSENAVIMAEKAIAILKAQGIRFFINETLRTQDVQNAYYAQGREQLSIVNGKRELAGLWLITEAENKKIVTNAKYSRHQDGDAIDIVPSLKNGNPWWNAPKNEYEKIAVVMKSCGFEWGGDWKGSWDQPHYQVKKSDNKN